MPPIPGIRMSERTTSGEPTLVPPPPARSPPAARHPASRIVHIPDCGHLIWPERPDVYGGEIVRFLQQLVAAR